MTRLYLIRHAEAEGNIYRIAHGHHNGLITNDRGYRQIDALRERFRTFPSTRCMPATCTAPRSPPGHLAAQGAAAAS